MKLKLNKSELGIIMTALSSNATIFKDLSKRSVTRDGRAKFHAKWEAVQALYARIGKEVDDFAPRASERH